MSFGPPFALNLNLLSPHSAQQLLLSASKAGASGAEATPSSSAPAVLPSPTDLGFPPFPNTGLPPGLQHGPSPFPIPPIGFFPGFPPHELKSTEGFGAGGGLMYGDPGMMNYGAFGGPLDLNGARRKNATRETTAALKAWLYEHRKNPYPTKGEKIMLAIITKMTLTQVSTWFANARRRLKKENKMTWSPRNRPGEDDEDLGEDEEGASSARAASTPPSSPPLTLLKDEDEENNGREKNNNSEAGSDDAAGAPPPKRPKIWSIADTVESRPPAPQLPPQLPPTSSGPLHFTFNPWQQQAAALAGLLRPGFPGGNPFLGHFRPDFRLPFPPPGAPHLLFPHQPPTAPPPPSLLMAGLSGRLSLIRPAACLSAVHAATLPPPSPTSIIHALHPLCPPPPSSTAGAGCQAPINYVPWSRVPGDRPPKEMKKSATRKSAPDNSLSKRQVRGPQRPPPRHPSPLHPHPSPTHSESRASLRPPLHHGSTAMDTQHPDLFLQQERKEPEKKLTVPERRKLLEEEKARVKAESEAWFDNLRPDLKAGSTRLDTQVDEDTKRVSKLSGIEHRREREEAKLRQESMNNDWIGNLRPELREGQTALAINNDREPPPDVEKVIRRTEPKKKPTPAEVRRAREETKAKAKEEAESWFHTLRPELDSGNTALDVVILPPLLVAPTKTPTKKLTPIEIRRLKEEKKLKDSAEVDAWLGTLRTDLKEGTTALQVANPEPKVMPRPQKVTKAQLRKQREEQEIKSKAESDSWFQSLRPELKEGATALDISTSETTTSPVKKERPSPAELHRKREEERRRYKDLSNSWLDSLRPSLEEGPTALNVGGGEEPKVEERVKKTRREEQEERDALRASQRASAKAEVESWSGGLRAGLGEGRSGLEVGKALEPRKAKPDPPEVRRRQRAAAAAAAKAEADAWLANLRPSCHAQDDS